METEIWKDVPDYEGLYQVSNLGRVKSLPKSIKRKGNCKIITKEKILKLCPDTAGYYRVSFFKNNKIKQYSIHKLVAMAFLNHTPCRYKEVINHIDFNIQNNNINNLEVVSMRENSNRKHIKHSSIYTGVHLSKYNSWISVIKINGKGKHLGSYKNEFIAHINYELALAKIKANLAV